MKAGFGKLRVGIPRRSNPTLVRVFLTLCAGAIVVPGSQPANSAAGQSAPAPPVLMKPAISNGGNPAAAPHTAPPFTLPDLNDRMRSLKDFQDRPVVLFFACGSWSSQECLRLWLKSENAGIFSPDSLSSGKPEVASKASSKVINDPLATTIVVFLGEPDDARDLVAEAGLDTATTVVLTDPTSQTAKAYNVTFCPRVVVIDKAGEIRYTNGSLGAGMRDLTPAAVIAHAVNAEREVAKGMLAPSAPISDKKTEKGTP